MSGTPAKTTTITTTSTTPPTQQVDGNMVIMDLKLDEWPASLQHILADPIVQQHVRLCPILGWIILLDVDRFMDAVHRRYNKAGNFQQFKDAMTRQWGWIYFGQRGGNLCHFVHEMGFGRGGFHWEDHPRPKVIRQHRELVRHQPPAQRAHYGGLVVNPPTLPPFHDIGYVSRTISAQMQHQDHIDPTLEDRILQLIEMLKQHTQQRVKNLSTIAAHMALLHMQHQEGQLATGTTDNAGAKNLAVDDDQAAVSM